jgi:hypothetical protein
MRKVLSAVGVAVAALALVPGVAAAEPPATYEVSDAWVLTTIDGRPTIIPVVDSNVVNLRCRGDDRLTFWSVNDPELVANSAVRRDGVVVQPAFDGGADVMELTVTCQRNNDD